MAYCCAEFGLPEFLRIYSAGWGWVQGRGVLVRPALAAPGRELVRLRAAFAARFPATAANPTGSDPNRWYPSRVPPSSGRWGGT